MIIGRRPQGAFGNSTGDQQMLEYTGAGDGARLMMLVHHDDAKRGGTPMAPIRRSERSAMRSWLKRRRKAGSSSS